MLIQSCTFPLNFVTAVNHSVVALNTTLKYRDLKNLYIQFILANMYASYQLL